MLKTTWLQSVVNTRKILKPALVTALAPAALAPSPGLEPAPALAPAAAPAFGGFQIVRLSSKDQWCIFYTLSMCCFDRFELF